MKKLSHRFITYMLLSTIMGLYSVISHAQNFYKWTDANGSTHYTLDKPPKHIKKVEKINTYNDIGTRNQQTEATTSSQNNKNESSQEKTRPEQNSVQKIPLPAKQIDPTQGQPIPIQQGSGNAIF